MRSILNFKPSEGDKKLPDKPLRVIGIDLGTTNSTAVEVSWDPQDQDHFHSKCIEVEQPTLEGLYTHVLVPSVVALYDGKEYVGEGAKRLRARSAEIGLDQYKNIFSECKNEMGLRRTYHRAPQGFRSAPEIAGHVLAFLNSAAEKNNSTESSRRVISVPASFQIAQRQDTLLAATLAGLQISPGDLIDEPVAAFLDFLMQSDDASLADSSADKRLLVFDFGGGTCDVAILNLKKNKDQNSYRISPLAVSRYHRLGGGDIDRAIVHNVLLAQIREQNGLSQYELTYEDKKRFIEPAFLGVAEGLKVGLSIETARLRKFGQYDQMKNTLVKTQPGMYSCQLKNRTVTLRSPHLSAEQFEKNLQPFLDRDLLYAHESEYRLTCSIFAPLEDALNRANLKLEEIDLCLMVGGSSLIPQITDAVAGYFKRAKMLTYTDRDSLQLAVARGAAIHALSLALFGKGIIQPVCHNSISIRTSDTGLVELIPKGVELPYPATGGFDRYVGLAVPEVNLSGALPLRVEFVAGKDEYTIESGTWQIIGAVKRGDPLCLEYRLDQNHVLDARLSLLADDSNAIFKMTIEHPLTNVVNPDMKRVKIDELEENLRTGRIPKDHIPYLLVQLGELYAEIGQREKAVDFFRKALLAKNAPDASILNKLAIAYGELGDVEREEKCYREASAAEPAWGGALFNLALAQRRRHLNEKALESLEEALRRESDPPYNILRAMLLRQVGRNNESDEVLQTALKLFEDISLQSDWTLHWYLTGLRMAKNEKQIVVAENEIRSRKKVAVLTPSEDGLLPIMFQKKTEQDK